jgi:hypothetical protein
MLYVEKIHGKERLFLETTAQVYRLSGVMESRERVDKILRQYFETHSESNPGCKLITSTVVYAEFLSITVKDILVVRDLVKEKFLDKNIFRISLDEIDDSLSLYPKIRGKRAQRIFAVMAALNRKFRGFQSIETKRVIRFLDKKARKLAFKDFFEIRLGGEVIKIEENSPYYLKEIGCLTKDPLQEDCNTKNGYECRHKIDVPNGNKDGHGDKCLVYDSPITKCRENPGRYCDINEFFNKSDIKKNLELLKSSVNELKFSADFRKKSKNKKWLEGFNAWDFTKGKFVFRGRNCWSPFFDMIMLLQCPDDAAILSNDPDFWELGKAIGRDDIWIPF